MAKKYWQCEYCKNQIYDQAKVHQNEDSLEYEFYHQVCFLMKDASQNNAQYYRSQAIAREFASDNGF